MPGPLENLWHASLSRRRALRGLTKFLAGSSLLHAQQDVFRDHSRVPAMDELITTFDFEASAFAKLSREAYNYTAYGSGTEFTLRRNRQAFDWVDLVPRGVADVREIKTATKILNTAMDFPILISPSAGHLALHPEGEAATYQGATAASNTPMIISYVASLPVDKIAAAAKGPLWYQIYPRQVIEENREVLDKAQSAGCRAVVVTVDQQAAYYERYLHDRNLTSREERDSPRAARQLARSSRRGGQSTNAYRVATGRLWYEWKLFADLRAMVNVPLIAKGILTGDDARLCVEHGLDAIIISNHGGRALDYSPSTLEVLEEVVEAVGGRIPVLIDGGFRRGSDILKALALGASAVCLGRVPRWGLGAFGPQGVQRVLEIMQAELAAAMAATGRPAIESIDRTLVRTDFV